MTALPSLVLNFTFYILCFPAFSSLSTARAKKPLHCRGLFLVWSQAMPAKLHKPRLGASSEQVESLVSEKMRQIKCPERAGERMRAFAAVAEAFGTWNFETWPEFHRK